jgi:hypothetical protein
LQTNPAVVAGQARRNFARLLSVPPTSLKSVQQYFMALLSRAIPYWGVVTKIALEKATNDDGIAYSKMTFSGGRILSPEQRAAIAPFHLQMQEMLAPGIIDARDYAEVETAGNQNTEPDSPF